MRATPKKRNAKPRRRPKTREQIPWLDFEIIAKAIFESLLKADGLSNVQVKHNELINGTRVDGRCQGNSISAQ